MKIIGIYTITCLANGKVYIGQSNDIKRRWVVHKNELKNNKHTNTYLQNAWNKYGKENFKFEIVQECDSREELNYCETYWFDYYCEKIGKENIYNLSHTGNAHNTSEKLRKWQSEFHKNHPNKGTFKKGQKLSNESRKKLSDSSTRKRKVAQYNAYGCFIKTFDSLKQASEETKIHSQDISRCCKGKSIKAGNYIWRYANDNNSNILVDERTTDIILGKTHHNTGKRASVETRKKMSVTRIGKSPLIKLVDQYDLEGNFIKTWKGFTSIERYYGKGRSHIQQCCLGKRKTCLGFKWKLHIDKEITK